MNQHCTKTHPHDPHTWETYVDGEPLNFCPGLVTATSPFFHPAQITLYTNPDGQPAVVHVNGVPYVRINTDEGRAAVAFIHAATAPRQPATLAEAGVHDLDTLPRLILDRNSGDIVVTRNDGPFLIEFRKDTP